MDRWATQAMGSYLAAATFKQVITRARQLDEVPWTGLTPGVVEQLLEYLRDAEVTAEQQSELESILLAVSQSVGTGAGPIGLHTPPTPTHRNHLPSKPRSITLQTIPRIQPDIPGGPRKGPARVRNEDLRLHLTNRGEVRLGLNYLTTLPALRLVKVRDLLE